MKSTLRVNRTTATRGSCSGTKAASLVAATFAARVSEHATCIHAKIYTHAQVSQYVHVFLQLSTSLLLSLSLSLREFYLAFVLIVAQHGQLVI